MRVKDGKQRILTAMFSGVSLLAAACSGGDSSPASIATGPEIAPPPTPTALVPTFEANVFQPSTDFVAQCETVRTGTDIEGNTFPDSTGSTLLENFWLRSWTEETYLFNDEVVDQDPALFDDRLDYFAELRTTATTASGEDKDDFHFSQPTEDFLASRNSAASASYGISLIALSTSPPRDFRVRYTEPNSPATEETLGETNLIRGTRILEVDGVDLVSASSDADIEVLNAGLFPQTVGERHRFVVQDPGSTETRIIDLTSVGLAPNPVNRFSIIDTPTGRVGYVLFNTFGPFSSERQLAQTFTSLSNEGVSDLVLDIRYNGGGLLAIAAQLGYMIAGPDQTDGRVFEALRFNTPFSATNPVTGESNSPTPFFDEGLGFSLSTGVDLDSLDLPRVFVLSTGRTCSASESVINSLVGIGVDVILIGDTTCGKPFGFFPTDNCGETYFTIQFQGVNDAGFGDYTDGFVPSNSTFPFGVKLDGCVVADDLDNELGDPAEALLAAALEYRETGTCPVAAPAPLTAPTSSAAAARPVGRPLLLPKGGVMDANRDMSMPN
ncbi:MAG: S41 family peptidase [Pseudomonadota bacterium]